MKGLISAGNTVTNECAFLDKHFADKSKFCKASWEEIRDGKRNHPISPGSFHYHGYRVAVIHASRARVLFILIGG